MNTYPFVHATFLYRVVISAIIARYVPLHFWVRILPYCADGFPATGALAN